MSNKTIFLLVGPKGAGKSFLAQSLEDKLAIPFIRVEAIWLALKNEKTLQGEAFEKEGLHRVLERVAKELDSHGRAVLETTGAAHWLSSFIEDLRRLGELKLIRVGAPLEVCLERIKARDQSNHLPVSADQIRQINQLALQVNLPWDLQLENSVGTPIDDLVHSIQKRFLGS